MAKVPPFIINMVSDVPDQTFEKVLKALKITEKDTFKSYAAKNAVTKNFYGNFVLNLFSLDKPSVDRLYKSVEKVLFVGGCAPGVGIAFNIIDACFCLILGNWLGCLVAIVSCFPIPGFKVAGKGFEKILVVILKKMQLSDLLKFTKTLGTQLSRIGFHSTKSYIVIRQQIEQFIPLLHNPFAESIIREFGKIISHFPTSANIVSQKVCQTGTDLAKKYSVQPKFLEHTVYGKIR